LKKGEDWIVSFVTAGVKNYAYKTFKGISKAIVKGFSLNNVAINSVNFESIKDIVINDNSKTLEIEQLLFKRDKVNWYNSTSIINKRYRYFFGKRCVVENFQTLPWGY
jgi:hypothetical protein